MPGKLARAPGLFLTGFMGSGKSTVGRLLADEMGWQFIDLDELIEREQGAAISEIFSSRGEDEFRRIEHEALRLQLRAAERSQPRVVALGGGAFAEERNRLLLAPMGTVVWLDAPLELLLARVARENHRPLAHDPVKFAELYQSRRPSYAEADFRVDAGAEPRVIVDRILELPLW